MSAPRIETLLVSLVVLIAAGIALAAAYAPPVPRQPQAELVQELAPEEAEASIAPQAPERNDDRSTASNTASSVIDVAVQQVAGMDAKGRIAFLTMSGAASLMLAIVVVRRRQRAAGAPLYGRPNTDPADTGLPSCERPGIAAEDQRSAPAWDWRATVRRLGAGAQKYAYIWAFVLRCVATCPGVYRRVQHWKHARLPLQKRGTKTNTFQVRKTSQYQRSAGAASLCLRAFVCAYLKGIGIRTSLSKCDQHPSLLHGSPSASGDKGQPIDQATDNHRLVAASQSEPDAAEAHHSILTADSAAAVAIVLDVYERQGLTQSEMIFAEASIERQRVQVRLMVAAHPDEAGSLENLPDQVQTIIPGSKAQWQRATQAQSALTITMRRGVSAGRGGHLLLPVARHQPGSRLLARHRSAPAVSFLPLRTWRHIGFYGGKAVESASAALIDLLYAEAPDSLAVTIIDQGQISSLCKGMPHIAPLPGAAADSLVALGRSARSFSPSSGTVRPVLIAVVEPDATLLSAYSDLVARLLRRPDAPVYTVLVQTRLSDVVRRPHPSLPAVITGSGAGRLTGAGDTPPPGMVRIVIPHIRIERRCHVYDAARLAALTEMMRVSSVRSLRPTVWDVAGAS
ncbi:MAG: hypothetical protein RMJ55_05770 [Roseiflexaceae bacterium]|nr:hypothetical protein [Roseiflexaceae bacterium]